MTAIAQVVRQLPKSSDPNLLVGPEHFADAGVYRLAPDLAMVQTLDFFPPLVDDPYVFGRIAAANALSDVYAMGGRPVTAMNIVAFPDNELGMEVLAEILRGGAERVAASGAVIVGGHSVRDVEIKYGLSVTGLVDPARMLTNEAAKAGDVLVLTKPLGTGFITTANRAGRCEPGTLACAVESMVALNKGAAEAAVELGARCATDITGFGLAGHASEIARASSVTIEIDLARLPLLPGSEDLASSGRNDTRANSATRGFLESKTRVEPRDSNSEARVPFAFDPQTSGGLLIAIDPRRAGALVTRCVEAGAIVAAIVGEVKSKSEVDLVLR